MLEKWWWPAGITDTNLSIWKACSNNIPNFVGQNITVYGTVLTITGISPSEIVLSEADETRVWSIPNWPWTSSGA